MNMFVREPQWLIWPKCAPAFKKDGTVTAGNASGINDGAAFLVLANREQPNKTDINRWRDWYPMHWQVFQITSWAKALFLQASARKRGFERRGYGRHRIQ